MIFVTSSFSKSPFSKLFLPHVSKREAGVLIHIPLVGRKFFEKLLLSGQISVDGRPNRRNRAALSNFTGVVWTSPESRRYETFSFNGRHDRVEERLLFYAVV